ncbi:hypothetical protein WN943_012934 [Citrus x changshan-huyou]
MADLARDEIIKGSAIAATDNNELVADWQQEWKRSSVAVAGLCDLVIHSFMILGFIQLRPSVTPSSTNFRGSTHELHFNPLTESPSTLIKLRRSRIIAVSDVKQQQQSKSTPSVASLLITKEEGLELYEDMVLGRSFEDMCAQMYTTEAKFGMPAKLKTIERNIHELVDEAVEFADASPRPATSQLLQNVFADAEGFGIGPDGRYTCEDPKFTLAVAY